MTIDRFRDDIELQTPLAQFGQIYFVSQISIIKVARFPIQFIDQSNVLKLACVRQQ